MAASSYLTSVTRTAHSRIGARSDLIGKGMVPGFTRMAWPVCCRTTGVTGFCVNQAGQVLQRDLGPNTVFCCQGDTPRRSPARLAARANTPPHRVH